MSGVEEVARGGLDLSGAGTNAVDSDDSYVSSDRDHEGIPRNFTHDPYENVEHVEHHGAGDYRDSSHSRPRSPVAEVERPGDETRARIYETGTAPPTEYVGMMVKTHLLRPAFNAAAAGPVAGAALKALVVQRNEAERVYKKLQEEKAARGRSSRPVVFALPDNEGPLPEDNADLPDKKESGLEGRATPGLGQSMDGKGEQSVTGKGAPPRYVDEVAGETLGWDPCTLRTPFVSSPGKGASAGHTGQGGRVFDANVVRLEDGGVGIQLQGKGRAGGAAERTAPQSTREWAAAFYEFGFGRGPYPGPGPGRDTGRERDARGFGRHEVLNQRNNPGSQAAGPQLVVGDATVGSIQRYDEILNEHGQAVPMGLVLFSEAEHRDQLLGAGYQNGDTLYGWLKLPFTVFFIGRAPVRGYDEGDKYIAYAGEVVHPFDRECPCRGILDGGSGYVLSNIHLRALDRCLARLFDEEEHLNPLRLRHQMIFYNPGGGWYADTRDRITLVPIFGQEFANFVERHPPDWS